MERKLVEQAMRGDEAAFDALIGRVGDQLHSVARRILRDPYLAEDATQRALLDARAEATIGDTLLLVEHPPVLTFGRRDSRSDVLVDASELAARGIAVHETNRGGLVTYHGPGQLVGYPIVGLRALTGSDVVRYVCGLEETQHEV